jgi:hypothetical protein
MSKTVREYFGLNAVAVQDCSKIYGASADVIDSDLAVGIEVEVESFTAARNPNGNVWILKGDGSLRNNGVEFITMPISARYAPAALDDLLGKSLSKDCCFSPRTSIHVHVDMQSFETNQVMDVVLLYTLLESLFYKYAGRGRIKNIYCVPVFDTSMLRGQAARNHLGATTDAWSKYSGLNLLRLKDLGTMEFRHMHGTFDAHKVSIWIRLITKLCTFARNAGSEYIRKLCQSAEGAIDVPNLLRDVFGSDADYLKYRSFEDVRRGLDAVRLAFVSDKSFQTYRENAQAKRGAYFVAKLGVKS